MSNTQESNMKTPSVSTPEQVAERRRAAIAPEVNAFIERIEDGLLSAPTNGSGEFWFTVGRLSRPIIDEVMARYAAAGWETRYEFDQRDGDAIVLAPKGGGR